jgi:DNA-binding MarR family transcriptional regulator
MDRWQDGSEVRLLGARLGWYSGYFSRLLRRLEAEGLVTTDPDNAADRAAAGSPGYRDARR